jgi:hypothetical protein
MYVPADLVRILLSHEQQLVNVPIQHSRDPAVGLFAREGCEVDLLILEPAQINDVETDLCRSSPLPRALRLAEIPEALTERLCHQGNPLPVARFRHRLLAVMRPQS